MFVSDICLESDGVSNRLYSQQIVDHRAIFSFVVCFLVFILYICFSSARLRWLLGMQDNLFSQKMKVKRCQHLFLIWILAKLLGDKQEFIDGFFPLYRCFSSDTSLQSHSLLQACVLLPNASTYCVSINFDIIFFCLSRKVLLLVQNNGACGISAVQRTQVVYHKCSFSVSGTEVFFFNCLFPLFLAGNR